MSRNGTDLKPNFRSLRRKREEREIEAENYRMMVRIINKTPSVKLKQMD